jgi:hypothetical protein
VGWFRVRTNNEKLRYSLGQSFRIQASTNLVDWSEASLMHFPEDGLRFLDAGQPIERQKFYRAITP